MLSSNTFGEFGRKRTGEYMSYLVLKGTVIVGKQVRAGDVVEIGASEARELMSTGKICKAETKVVETVDRSIGLS